MKKGILFFLHLMVCVGFSQTGIIRGKVIDQQTEVILTGATVELIGSESLGVVTDAEGNFALKDIPIGRQSIRVSYIGYETLTVSELDVTTGKEVIVQVGLLELLDVLQEVVLTSERSKATAINVMSAVSTRQFTTEEVNRFAGGRSDVSRLVSNFAGVSTADDSRNDIVVRGNSPTGLLWRLEGIPIPSPNHFATLGTTGSPVSALNPNLLANSDFMTSAFAAEYGNAIGGVFDLGFRKGNIEDYEFTVGVGAFPGLELMAEGPMGKNGGSFIVSGRYGVAGTLGLAGTSAQPNYSDLSFNVNFGRSKVGTFSLFGIYGTSDIDFLGEDFDPEDLFASEDQDSYVTSGFSTVGLKHVLDIGSQSYLKTIVGYSSSSNTYEEDRYLNLNQPDESKIRYTSVDNSESRISFSTLFNTKINKRIIFRTGALVEQFSLDNTLKDRDRQPDTDLDGLPDFNTLISNEGDYSIVQPFAQGQFRVTDKLTLNAGIHGQYFSLNEEFIAEPRASVTYAFNPKNTLTVGYGLHSQNVAAPLLFLNESIDGTLQQTNKNLDFVRNQHFVVGYDIRLADKWRAKVEVYYQTIDQAAVEQTPTSYSSLTEGADFVFSTDKVSLVSEGVGFNQGFEFTLEKFFSKGYYALFTTSLFESTYEGSDGIERNSPFNNGYVVNAVAGKEFKIGSAKKNVFSINTKFTTAGGRYYTPVDLEASIANGFEVRDDSVAFSEQYDPYLRLDLRFAFKFNSAKKKSSHQFYIDFQNITNNENVFSQNYNRVTQRVDQVNQIGFQPDFGYRFQF
ncbi:carboxypeptidase-like regulatory domain-containing protein [Flavobacterium sp.]|jgi:hypothetical protein|uniref:TonB-dependent receptor n=1 Tax=Flavobacterium sp. TaxID=239 RepID=UPI0037C188D6